MAAKRVILRNLGDFDSSGDLGEVTRFEVAGVDFGVTRGNKIDMGELLKFLSGLESELSLKELETRFRELKELLPERSYSVKYTDASKEVKKLAKQIF